MRSGPHEHGRQSRDSPVFTILDGGLAKAGPVQKWGVPASVCAGGEDTVCGGGRSGLLPVQARQRAGRHFGGAAGFPPCLFLRPLIFCVVTLSLLRVGIRGGNGRDGYGAM